MNYNRLPRNIGTLLAVSAIGGSVAHAALLSTESFTGYNAGEIQATNPSPTVSGYTGNWTDTDFGNGEPTITSGSLTYSNPLYLGSSGDKVGVAANTGGNAPLASSGRVYRQLDSSLAVTNSTTGTLYLSFLFQRGTAASNGYQTLALGTGTSFDSNRYFDIGNFGSGTGGATDFNFGVRNTANTNQDYSSTGVALNTSVNLFVVKFTLSATGLSDSVTVWTNPVLGGVGDPTGGVTVSGRDLSWSYIAISDYDDTTAAWDELRWGTSFNDVTVAAVPEPSSFAAIAGLAGVAAVGLRRRRKTAA
jgi:hypothetical protein